MPSPEKTPAQECREWRDKNLGFWRPYYDAMREYRAFLDGDRYVANSDWYNRDRRLVQIVGRETDDAVRHYVSKAMERAVLVQPRPIDQESDPDQGEVEVALLNGELENPLKGFRDFLQMTVRDSRELGMGMLWMDWNPDFGPWGEITFSAENPSRFMWDRSYSDMPHHLLCNRLQRVHRMDVDLARERYKAPWLRPDREGSRTQSRDYGTPLLNLRQERDDYGADDEMVTVIEEWRKNDKTVKGMKETDQRKLKPDDRYMVCETCGYRSDTQGVLRRQEKIQEELPPFMTPCPECSLQMGADTGVIERVDVLGMEQPSLLYAKGRRLIIYAPHQQGPDDEPLWDKGWPVSKARSFPMLYLCMDPKRGRPMGESDPSWNWSQQLAADHLRTQALQRVGEHRTYKRLPAEGITNADGKRFEFRDDDMDTMFADNAAMGPLDVQFYNSSGVDPAWGVAFEPIYNTLVQYRGQYDQGPVEDRAAKSGVALRTENAIGEIPVQRFKELLNRSLSHFYGVLSDYIHATYTPARLARLNIEGVDIVTRMWGQDLPNYDFVIENAPEDDGLTEQRAKTVEVVEQAIQKAVTLGLDPVEYIEVIAEPLKLSRSMVRKMQKLVGPIQAQMEQQRMLQEQEALMAQGGAPQDEEAALLEEEQAMMNGGNGAGMVPGPEGLGV